MLFKQSADIIMKGRPAVRFGSFGLRRRTSSDEERGSSKSIQRAGSPCGRSPGSRNDKVFTQKGLGGIR